MTYAAFDNNDAYQPHQPYLWEQTPSYAPTPSRECTPSVICTSPDPERFLVNVHRPSTKHSPINRVFCEWISGKVEENTMNNHQTTFTTRLSGGNNRVVAKDT
jgi:hypothetical protein